jgi:hypothetical protein
MGPREQRLRDEIDDLHTETEREHALRQPAVRVAVLEDALDEALREWESTLYYAEGHVGAGVLESDRNVIARLRAILGPREGVPR